MAEVGLLPFARIARKSPKRCWPATEAVSATPIHAASIASDSLPVALRRRDLPGNGGASGRASRVASGYRADQRSRFHHAVSFSAAVGRANHRPRGRAKPCAAGVALTGKADEEHVWVGTPRVWRKER
jgi:hypothetical protein